MTCKDLMVGDLVQGHLPNTPSKVVGIPNEYRLAVITPGGAYMELSIDDFLPIPITPEILEKNGIKKKITEAPYFGYYHAYFSITPDVDSDNQPCWMLCIGDDNNDANICIYYVHQLQNCLNVVGINKDIVL